MPLPAVLKKIVKDASRGDLKETFDLESGIGLAENNQSELEDLLKGEVVLKASTAPKLQADVELVKDGEETPEQ